jgi:uncharacterized protein (DUF924 family)
MYNQVLNFWFVETPPRMWWAAEPAFDAAIVARFADVHAAAARSELYEWRREPRGRLASSRIFTRFS